MRSKSLKFIAIILITLSIGLIYIYPDLRFIFELKNEFKGITLTATPDELGYLARIKAVYKGNLTCRSIDIYEHRNDPWLQPFLCELIEGSVGRFLGINVVLLDILMSFILPVILFWVIFLLIKNLCGSAVYSFFGSALILLGYDLFAIRCFDILKKLFVWQSYSFPLWFLRPISPQLNHVFFMVAILMLYISINKKSIFYAVLAAVFSGALFYILPHYWIYIYAGISVFIIFSVTSKNRGALKVIFYFILFSMLISLPFWLHIYKLKFDQNFSNTLSFTGLLHTYRPIFPVFHIILTIAIIAILWYLKDPSAAFLSSFLIGGIFCLNQQVITGITLVPGHWQGYSNKTFIMLALTVALFKVISNIKPRKEFTRLLLKRGKLVLFICTSIFLYTSAFMQQSNYYKAHRENARINQPITDVYNWFNRHAKDTDVVLTHPHNVLSGRSPSIFEVLVYTDCYTYPPSGSISLASLQENEERLLYAFNFYKYTPREFESYLRLAKGAFFAGISVLPEYGGKGISDSEISRIKDKYISLNRRDAVGLIKKYKIDYAIIDNQELFNYSEFIKLGRLKVAYQDKNYIILKIIS